MPMMAHSKHGFKSANSGEVPELITAGWVVCDDIMKFKREVMGIGKPVEPVKVVEVEEKPATIEVQPKRRAGRPRKEEIIPSILNDGDSDGDSTNSY